MKNCVRCAWLALGLLSLNHVEYSLSAQMFDNPIEAKLWYFVRGEGGSPSPSVQRDFGAPYRYFQFTVNSGAMEKGAAWTKIVNLGEEYSFDFTATDMEEYEFVFDLPPNMTVYLDGIERSVIHQDDIVGDSFTLQVLPRNQALVFSQSSGLATAI